MGSCTGLQLGEGLGRFVIVISVMDRGRGFKGSLSDEHSARYGDRWSDSTALEAAFLHGLTFRRPWAWPRYTADSQTSQQVERSYQRKERHSADIPSPGVGRFSSYGGWDGPSSRCADQYHSTSSSRAVRTDAPDPIAIDIGEVLQRTVTSLYSSLITRPTGRAVRMAIETQLRGAGTLSVSLIDFSEVGIIDYSCADEVVAKLLSNTWQTKDGTCSSYSEGSRTSSYTGRGGSAAPEVGRGSRDRTEPIHTRRDVLRSRATGMGQTGGQRDNQCRCGGSNRTG